jgi:hypothetical protein
MSPSVRRIALAVIIGSALGLANFFLLRASPANVLGGDFTYPWLAARSLLHGSNPYHGLDHAGLKYGEFFYPLPTALIVLPVAWINDPQIAGSILMALAGAWLAFVLTRRAWWPLLLFVSAPAFAAATNTQWALFVMAASMTVPAIGLVIAKPNLGLALIAMQCERRAFISAVTGGGILLLVSLVILPTWPMDWLHELRTSPTAALYHPPILTASGCVVALAGFRWRDPRARLLLVMACVPQTGLFYDQGPLLLLAASRTELLALSLCTVAAAIAAQMRLSPGMDTLTVSALAYPYMVAGCYWPALALFLRHCARQRDVGPPSDAPRAPRRARPC